MPRHACTQCRTKKLRCIDLGHGQKCQRCNNRSLECSYSQDMSQCKPTIGTRILLDYADKASTSNTTSKPQYLGQLGPLNTASSGLDIGDGTPAEILREGQLTQTLLLLYFSNYNDVHFMFDQSMFLRQYALGNSPKVLLYAMMALGIRYSYAPFKNPQMRAHWGEPLYHEARRLMKDEFDHPSVINAQAYILLATYNLAFGGSRKAWVYLNTARSFVSLLGLELHHAADDSDVVQAELSRRLIATIVLMENTLTPCLEITHVFSRISPVPPLYSEEEFDKVKTGTHQENPKTSPNVVQEILVLSGIYYEACNGYRESTHYIESRLLQRLSEWQSNLHNELQYSKTNLEAYRDKLMLRPFVFMHLLYHTTQEILLFMSLDWSSATLTGLTPLTDHALCMYQHATEVSQTVSQLRKSVGFDLQNGPFGQAVTLSAVALVHQLLCTRDMTLRADIQSQLLLLRDSLTRVKQHSRLFECVYNQLECFFRVCSQDAFWENDDWSSCLHDQMVMLGTSFERLNYETAGRIEGLERFYNTQSYAEQQNGQIPRILTREFINVY